MCAGRMNEGDQRVVRARPRLVVDQPDAAGLEPREHRRDVVDPERDVVQAGAALGHVLGNRRVLGVPSSVRAPSRRRV